MRVVMSLLAVVAAAISVDERLESAEDVAPVWLLELLVAPIVLWL